MIRVADYVIRTLADRGVDRVFLVTGGGAMFLNDAIGREKRIRYLCNHHEQACSMAAEAYARVSGSLGVINVTTGPGGINALNGVYGAWTDSLPLLVLSGQVKRETCLPLHPELAGLRQLGDQEVDIVRMARGVTKYAAIVAEPQSIRRHLEQALHLARSGRPGPCWLDIPVDVQASLVDEDALAPYIPEAESPEVSAETLVAHCRDIASRIRSARRPVILVGSGIHLAGAEELFDKVVRKLGIPVTTAWTAHDLVASDDPLACGRQGPVGDRAGNFTVQNADLLLVLGSRLSIRQVSYNWKSFAREAWKVQVDIDPEEMRKPYASIDLPICCDVARFLRELDRCLDAAPLDGQRHAAWVAWCKARVARYPVLLARHCAAGGPLNPYRFYHELFGRLRHDDVIACANGAASVVPFQVAPLKKGQRLFTNAGAASMGYELPAAIGAAVAAPGRRVICLAGDGSLQLNIQELQTIVHHQFNIKIFVLNNGGYQSIRSTQAAFFQGNFVGESPRSGISFPDLIAVGKAYGMATHRIEGARLAADIDEVLSVPGPVLCEVVADGSQQIEPRLTSKQLPDGRIVSPALEDLYPFLDRDELRENMLIAEWEGAS